MGQNFFLLCGWIIFHYMSISHFVYPFIHCWTDRVFPFFGYISMLLWTLVYKDQFEREQLKLLSVLLDVFLDTEMQNHMVIISLTFWETAQLFSSEAIQFYISTKNAQDFQFLHVLIKHRSCYADNTQSLKIIF